MSSDDRVWRKETWVQTVVEWGGGEEGNEEVGKKNDGSRSVWGVVENNQKNNKQKQKSKTAVGKQKLNES